MSCSIAMPSFRLILLGVSLGSALTLQSPSGLSNTLPSLINTTNSSIPLANRRLEWECDFIYPQNPNLAESCADAMRHMQFVPGSATQQFMWGPRGTGRRYDVYLPQRVYSSDGKCYIQVDVELEHPASSTARASQAQVQDGVAAVMSNCLTKTPPNGGTAKNFNDDGNIEVSIRVPGQPLEPPDMLCSGAMPPLAEASCRDLMNSLLVDGRSFRLGPSTDPNAELHTPLRFTSRDRRCQLIATTTGPTDTFNWYTMWLTGLELTDVCARQGKQGHWIKLGHDGHIIVLLTSPRADISSS